MDQSGKKQEGLNGNSVASGRSIGLVGNQGSGRLNLSDGVGNIPHKAGRLLGHLQRSGAGVLMTTAPWTPAQIQHATQQGPHKSAVEYFEFVCEELLKFFA